MGPRGCSLQSIDWPDLVVAPTSSSMRVFLFAAAFLACVSCAQQNTGAAPLGNEAPRTAVNSLSEKSAWAQAEIKSIEAQMGKALDDAHNASMKAYRAMIDRARLWSTGNATQTQLDAVNKNVAEMSTQSNSMAESTSVLLESYGKKLLEMEDVVVECQLFKLKGLLKNLIGLSSAEMATLTITVVSELHSCNETLGVFSHKINTTINIFSITSAERSKCAADMSGYLVKLEEDYKAKGIISPDHPSFKMLETQLNVANQLHKRCKDFKIFLKFSLAFYSSRAKRTVFLVQALTN